MKRLNRAALVVVLWLAACGGMLGKPTAGGESHFLRHCSEGCGELDCVADICTRSCLVDESSCSDLSPRASCTNASVEPGAVAVCDLTCSRDLDCAGLGDAFACSDGFCRSAVAAPTGAGGADNSGGGSLMLTIAGASPADGGGPPTAPLTACALDPGTTIELGAAAAACALREEIACSPEDPQTAEDLLNLQLGTMVRECVGGWEGELTFAFTAGCATALSGQPYGANSEEPAVVACLVQTLDSRHFSCADSVECASVSSHLGLK
jgi:hypothetical protein